MTMTKQHFEAIARALYTARPSANPAGNGPHPRQDARIDQWAHTVEVFTNVCAASNAQFKRDRFYDACGYTAAYGRS